LYYGCTKLDFSKVKAGGKTGDINGCDICAKERMVAAAE